MAQGARVRIAVERNYAVTAERGERMAREQAGRRLSHSALARDERDLPAAGDRRLDARDEFAMVKLGRTRPDVDGAPGQAIDAAPPPSCRHVSRRSQHALYGEVVGRGKSLISPGPGAITVRRCGFCDSLGGFCAEERHGAPLLLPQRCRSFQSSVSVAHPAPPPWINWISSRQ